MDELTLRRVMTKLLRHSGVNFLGVYPSDHLPCVTVLASRAPCCYIANSDPCTELGSHWVAFFHSSPKTLEFFDSYGKTPAYYGLSIPNTMSVKYNPLQLQADSSLLCGLGPFYFCIGARKALHSLLCFVYLVLSRRQRQRHTFRRTTLSYSIN